MYLIYSALLVFWGILLLPVFLYKAWRHQKYLPGLRERFGRLPESLRFDGRSAIWFHSCSVGETLSLQPIVTALRMRFPEARFVFSTITRTGRHIAEERFSEDGGGNIFYFPVDLRSIDRRVLDWIRPSMIVIVDTEIWPNLLDEARGRNIPVALVNGRISASSFRHYRLAKGIMRRVFRNYRILLMQSEEDARRIQAIGAPAEKIAVSGNIKFDRDASMSATDEAATQNLNACFGFSRLNDRVIVAGSTHPGEEQALLKVLKRLRSIPELSGTRLLLAPRHPERFDEVAALAAREGFTVRRRTSTAASQPNPGVLLLDSMGELAAAYKFASAAFVGGTLDRLGGHSIMEPALYSKAIVVGPSMQNFRGIMDEFQMHEGIRQITAGSAERERQIEELTQAFEEILLNAELRESLGKKAFSILERNRGAALRTADVITAVLSEIQNSTAETQRNGTLNRREAGAPQ